MLMLRFEFTTFLLLEITLNFLCVHMHNMCFVSSKIRISSKSIIISTLIKYFNQPKFILNISKVSQKLCRNITKDFIGMLENLCI